MNSLQSQATKPSMDELLHKVTDEMVHWDVPLKEAMRQFHAHYIESALRSADWNGTKASEKIKVHRNTIGRAVKMARKR